MEIKNMVDMNINILIVDDFKTMLKIIRSLLTQLGFQHIDDASNGSMAIEKLKEKKYQLIISDWNMEPVTGLELLKHVRSNEDTKKIPFIMVTAESETKNVIAAKQAGVSNYIVKPFNSETLKAKLTSVLGDF